ncbi:MAG: DNA mismatch repair endonuclease MutL [Dysgonamonadaceae bacterium]|jgi:DNA mismatch repair protein MutL|nr:DNA mismatch repair endonuclease MutL [Dysgonamonadaceae bacterium]
MSDIIRLLPDAIANQIAAGEVIQRPASVVKELVENAVDAGADTIQINIKDAGRTLIQVIDNGKGMSDTDARMAFERHATSKIRSADDLFALQTMGFRGEALASIVAVAQVELKTRRETDEVGTLLQISASQLEKQEVIATNTGSIFSVKNLFFNIPARRKFLKTNETEFKNIIVEFERIALVNPPVSFVLTHNDTEIYNLPVSVLRQRIINIFGKNLNQQLLPLNVETSLVHLSGFIGTPASSKKRGAEQFFFVNGRYMRHPYFHKAVMVAFEPFIPAGEIPNYFIYMNVDPASIDVNIHPTKTEIKFENEQAIWQIIVAAVKESIGKSSATPGLTFDTEGAINIPVYDRSRTHVDPPKVSVNTDYNPFSSSQSHDYTRKNTDWEQFFEKKTGNPVNTESSGNDVEQAEFFDPGFSVFQYKSRYLITPLKSGLVLIDRRRAHIRTLFDEFMKKIQAHQSISQGLLFPEIISFTSKEAVILPYLLDDFAVMGFELNDLGNNSYSINGIPAGLENIDAIDTLKDMVQKALETGCEVKEEVTEAIVLSLAKRAAIPYGKQLSQEEAESLISGLFASELPNYTPDGKLIISTLTDDEIDKRFK